MFAMKQGTSNRIPIGIMDTTTGLGVTGLAYNAVGLSFKLAKAGAAAVAKVLAPSDWVEIGNGWYWVTLSAADCDTLGVGLLITLYSGTEGAYPFEVRANLEADVFSRVGAPVGASISADLAAVKADTAAGLASLARLLGISDENSVRDSMVYSGTDLTSARIRAYDSAANALAAGATGLLFTWNVAATYSAPGVLSTYKVTVGP